MSTARWSLRLPRVHRVGKPAAASAPLRRNLIEVRQKRWLRTPPQRAGPWTGNMTKTGSQEEIGHERLKHTAESLYQRPQNPQAGRNTQLATTLAEADSSDLVTDVRIPEDPGGILPLDHPAISVLGNSSLVIQRQLEMMNLLAGFEQANRYIIMDGEGQTVGYIIEQDHGIGRAIMRQWTTTHRSFTTHIFDKDQKEVLRIHRPFSFINSRIRIYDPVPRGGYTHTEASSMIQGLSTNQDTAAQLSPFKLEEMRIIGEAQQQWAPLRRKYNLFSYRAIAPALEHDSTRRLESGERSMPVSTALTEAKAPDQAIEAGMTQFAHVNEPFLSWDFTLRDEEQRTIGSVNRNFGGFAREIFTDTGVYALRMDSAAQKSALETADGREVTQYERRGTAMTLDQRAVMLSTAVCIDFDYFSRHSHAGSGGFMPIFWPMGSGAAEGAGAGAAGGAAVGEAGAVVGAAEGAGTGAVGAVGRGLGTAAGPAGEGAIAGAGTIAGYEAMQRGAYGPNSSYDDASPTTESYGKSQGDTSQQQSVEQAENRPGDDVWGESQDPWAQAGTGNDPPSTPGENGGGGGWMDSISDFFGDD